MREKGQKCVSKARVETHNEGKSPKMCVKRKSVSYIITGRTRS